MAKRIILIVLALGFMLGCFPWQEVCQAQSAPLIKAHPVTALRAIRQTNGTILVWVVDKAGNTLELGCNESADYCLMPTAHETGLLRTAGKDVYQGTNVQIDWNDYGAIYFMVATY